VPERLRIAGHSPHEPVVGYSRALRVGSQVFVSGTAPIPADGGDPPQGAYAQTKLCLEIALAALSEAGAGPEDVVRTRVYLVRAADHADAGRAHGEIFGDIRPASTMLAVGELLDPRWLVEIEADALVD
jgi:enamine deaminase RidA (YjgF/YER057c/UK114 family)